MYKMIIGLEVHAELNTNTKSFSSGRNLFNEKPNNDLSVIDMAFPGVLPRLNKEALNKAIKTSLFLNCDIPDYVLFDRKNYFYPDLPKGYQITQSHSPIGLNGYLTITNDKKIMLHDIHLEEDTANLTHCEDMTLINYNRAGVPLIEIVTEPCITSCEEALDFLETLRKSLVYLNVSEGKLEKGQIRCDVNVSLMKETDKELGTKVEVKNVNTWANIKETIEYEYNRQKELLDNNKKISQETRRFDEKSRTTISMRSKEDAIDYRYFIEPNIPKIKLSQKMIDDIKSTIPLGPYERSKKYINEYNLSEVDTNTLIKDKKMSDYFEECLKLLNDPKKICNWITSSILTFLNKYNLNINDIYITPQMLTNLIVLINEDKLTSKQGKEILTKALEEKKDPIQIFNESNITQISSDHELRNMIKEIINNNSQMVEKYKEGRNVLDFFIGQVMKQTKGQANPAITSKIAMEELKKI